MNKYAFPANKPPGNWINWRIGSGWFEIAGTEHRYDEALDFIHAAAKAWSADTKFGIALRRQPGNPHHRNAIQVFGVVGDHAAPRERWHIGFVPRDVADEAARLYPDDPIAAELKTTKIGHSRLFISVAGLIPKGTPRRD